jgi:trehalose/maltose transport system substrate-binding protein
MGHFRKIRPRVRFVVILSALSCLSVLVTGCARQGATQAGSRVTIVFKHAKYPQSEYLQQLIERFEAEEPKIHVREEILPSDTDQQHQFYVINLEGGSRDFDVMDMDIIWVPEFSRAGWLVDLTASISPAELSPLDKAAVRADWFGGKLYAVPWFVDTGVLYYRKDLLEKYGFRPPRTYAELSHMARVILSGEHNPRLTGFLWEGMQYEGLVCAALEFIRGNGGDVLRPDGTPDLTSGQTLGALKSMRDLIRTQGVTPPLVATLDEESARHVFQSGRAVFMRNWPYAWPLMQEADSPVAGRIGITNVPHFTGYSSAPTLGGFHLGVNSRSLHKKQAITFVRYMIGSSVQKDIFLHLGVLPADMSALTGNSMPSLAYLSELRSALELAVPRPVTPYYLMISQILQPELSAVVTGLRRPEDAMQAAQRQIEHLLGKQ